MKFTRRTQIRIETSRRISADAVSPEIIRDCPFCPAKEAMLRAEEAAARLNISRRAVYQMIEKDGTHFTEISGKVFLCPNWLNAWRENPAAPEQR